MIIKKGYIAVASVVAYRLQDTVVCLIKSFDQELTEFGLYKGRQLSSAKDEISLLFERKYDPLRKY